MKVTMIGASGFVGTRLLGLLKESEMEKEWKETEAKMLTILSVL